MLFMLLPLFFMALVIFRLCGLTTSLVLMMCIMSRSINCSNYMVENICILENFNAIMTFDWVFVVYHFCAKGLANLSCKFNSPTVSLHISSFSQSIETCFRHLMFMLPLLLVYHLPWQITIG